MKALIRFYAPDPRHPRTVAEVRVVDGKAVIDHATPVFRDELKKGVYGRHGRVTLAEGEAFIRELPYVYCGSYVRAELVQ